MKSLLGMILLLSSQNIYAQSSVSIEEEVTTVQIPQGLNEGAIKAMGGQIIVVQEVKDEESK